MSEISLEQEVNSLVDRMSSELEQTQSPEEAYKVFMSAAGKGLMQVMANALAEVVSSSSNLTKSNSKISGWEQYITGCSCVLDFGAPNSSTIFRTTNIANYGYTKMQGSVQPTNLHQLGGSINITVGGSWSF